MKPRTSPRAQPPESQEQPSGDVRLLRLYPAYNAAARWPEGRPSEFEAALDAARLYLDFRWLGESPAQLVDPGSRWYMDDLLVRGERLGLT